MNSSNNGPASEPAQDQVCSTMRFLFGRPCKAQVTAPGVFGTPLPVLLPSPSPLAVLGLVAQWRRQLHEYDPKDGEGDEGGGGDGSENVGRVCSDGQHARA